MRSAEPTARALQQQPGPRYKWVALSNTTLGMLMATINSSIVLIALPDIFRGIDIDPLAPANTGYLLWMIMGFLVVTAVLVVGFGRLGDMYGRVRMYNIGFAVFALSSVLLAVTWTTGDAAALWLIGWRVAQGIGGAFLMANSSAILTDAFPVHQRGLALGINGVAAIAGSFLGLVIGGLLGPANWHLVFLVSVPFGVFGTIWAYLKLRDTGRRRPARMDWWGNITFAVGLVALLVGITYGIQPYGGHAMGWTSPFVLSCLIGGVVVLIGFGMVEVRVVDPLFTLSLFGNRTFSLGNLANLLASLGRGGLQFVLIIWLQGSWLPQHGYSFAETPLWAGIYMLPLTIGFLIAAPLSGLLSDRGGARWYTSGGMILSAVSFLLLEMLPVDFDYRAFAALLLVNGLGMGLFASPNRAQVMNSLPPDARGAGAGMTATFQNTAMVLSIGFFFSLMIIGLSQHLPVVLEQGLLSHGVPAADAARIAQLPPVGVLFAAFLGYNPVQSLLGGVLPTLPADQASFLTGRSFFPQLIAGPFADGLTAAFWFAAVACVVGAAASWFCPSGRVATGAARREAAVTPRREPAGAELAPFAGRADAFPGELVDGQSQPQPRPRVGAVAGAVRTAHGTDLAGGLVIVTAQDGSQVGRVPVGAGGGYRLDGLTPGTYTVVATAPGFQADAAAVILNGHGAVQDFVLCGHGVVSGTVRAAGGDPSGTTLLATDTTGRIVGRTRTGRDGGFLLSGLPSGATTVTASLAGHQPRAVSVVVAPVAPAVLDLVLETAAVALAGTVSGPDGCPLAGATVTVTDGAGEVVAISGTDQDGGYPLGGLAPGGYDVVASAAPAVTHVELSGPAVLDLRLGAPQVLGVR